MLGVAGFRNVSDVFIGDYSIPEYPGSSLVGP